MLEHVYVFRARQQELLREAEQARRARQLASSQRRRVRLRRG